MKIYHTSPEKIEKITKSCLFDDCLFFSSSVYDMGNAKYIYSINIDKDEIIDTSMLDDEDTISHISNALDCTLEEAEEMLTGHLVAGDVTGNYEDGWFIQAQQGFAAKEMGYKAALDYDEQGSVYIVPMLNRESDLTIEEIIN